MTKRQREAERRAKKIQDTIIGLFALLVFIGALCVVGHIETHYTRDGVVKSVSNQLVSVEDKCGLVWEFYGNGYRAGDHVRLYMYNNGTDSNVYDDEIINVKLR